MEAKRRYILKEKGYMEGLTTQVQKTDPWIIGIDFGATQLRAALVSMRGISSIISKATPNQGGATEVWEALSGLIAELLSLHNGVGPVAICVGVPSVVDTVTGTVYDIQHIPACKELPLGNLIRERFGVQALVNNDANVFALGEFYFGQNISFRNLAPLSERKMYGAVDNPAAEETARPTAKSYKLVKKNTPLKAEEDLLGSDGADSTDENGIRETIKTASLVGLTIGTGLGAGLILNGRLYSGANCGAGEIGCLPYLDGNLEKYVSGAFFSNQGLDGKSCYALARNGDPKAIALYHAFGHHVGQAIKMAMYTYDPDSIVLGGSVSQAFDLFEKSMTDAIKDFDYPGILAKIKIYPSKLENSAILGAAALYYDAWK